MFIFLYEFSVNLFSIIKKFIDIFVILINELERPDIFIMLGFTIQEQRMFFHLLMSTFLFLRSILMFFPYRFPHFLLDYSWVFLLLLLLFYFIIYLFIFWEKEGFIITGSK